MNTIKYTIFSFILVCFGVTLFSCVDLTPYPTSELDESDMWKYPNRVQGIIGNMYTKISRTYIDNEAVFLECATDNAVSTSLSRNMTQLALNSLTKAQDPFLEYWENSYEGIYNANNFLKDNRGLNMRYVVDPAKNDLLRRRLQGEAYALRAWFYWSLLQKFGGESIDGQLLGVPIVTAVTEDPTSLNLPRAKYDDCVKQILNDCDSAYKYLPLAHRDFLSEDKVYGGAKYWSRLDGIITRAIKASVYLTWASPRFNPNKDMSRWENAAKYAKEVMDFKLNVDGRTNADNPYKAKAFSPEERINWANPNFAGAIWATQYSFSTSIEKSFYPEGFNGSGLVGPTQELVDAFPMKNGYPITDSRSGYDPQHPYKDRDPRFYTNIFFNGESIKRSSTGKVMYTFEMWKDGGKDAANISAKNSRTNYYARKFVYMDIDLSNANNTGSARRAKFVYEWKDMCLMFAEAANQVVGPTNSAKFGLSAKEALKYIRTRKTEENVSALPQSDPYLDEMAQNKETFDALVKNERRITTCFEGDRFYDLRRWNTSMSELNKPVHGVQITKKDDGTFMYDNIEVQKRSFTSPYLPIPYKEVLRMDELKQNKGWEIWK